MDPMAGSGAGSAGRPGFPAVFVFLSGSARSGLRVASAGMLLAMLLVSCAPVEQRRAEGASWVAQQEEERLRLEAMGFPQFSGPM